MKKAIIYARQSSGRDDQSDSVDTQIENCKALADRENIAVIGIYSDLNTSGKTYPVGAETIAETDKAFQDWFKQQTGNKMFRPGLGSAIKKLNEVDFIIVDDITRLYRPVAQSFLENYMNNLLTSNRVTIKQVKGGVIDLSKFDSALITMLRNMINDEQIANCKKKSMQALQARREKGLFANGGGKAFGTAYDKNTGSITITEKGITVATYVYSEYLNGAKMLDMINFMNQHFTDETTTRYYYSNLYNILNNPVYCGYMVNQSGLLVRSVQVVNPCIELEAYIQAKKMMEGRKTNVKRAKKHDLPFSGLLFCGVCGARLLVNVEDGANIRYCCKNRSLDRAKHSKGIGLYINNHGKYKGLEQAIAPIIAKTFLEMIEAENSGVDVDAVKADTVNLEKKVIDLTSIFKKGLLTVDELEAALQEVKAKINENNAVIASAANSNNHLNRWFNLKKALEFADGVYTIDEYKKALVQAVKRITVYTDRIVVETMNGKSYTMQKGRQGVTSRIRFNINGTLEVVNGIDFSNIEQIA